MNTVEAWTDQLATLPLPTIVFGLALLTAARATFRTSRAAFFRFLAEVCEVFVLSGAMVFLVLRPFTLQSYHIPTSSMQPTLREGDHILVNKLLYRLRKPRYGEAIVFRAPLDADATEREFLKRLIGLPGDTIEARPGFVQIGNVRFYHTDIRAALEQSLGLSDTNDELNPRRLRLLRDAIWIDGKKILAEDFARRVGAPPGTAVRIQPGQVLRNGEPLTEDFVAEDPEYQVDPQVIPPGFCYVLGDNRNQSHDSHRWGPLEMNRIVGRADVVFWPPRRIRAIE